MRLYYTLDDGKTWLPCEDIQVRAEYPLHIDDENEQVNAELVTKFTEDNLTFNVWVHNTCEASSSETFFEIGDRLL